MQYDIQPMVRVIGQTSVQLDNGNWTIPFASEIEKIYRGYRQCYSEDPFYDAPVNREMYDKLKAEAAEYDNEISEKYQKYGEKEYLDFFRKCQFICKHRAHESQLEHGLLTVQVSGVDRTLTHQWVRSRIASHGQQSQRYVKFDDLSIITPPSIRKKERSFAAFKQYLNQIPDLIKIFQEDEIPTEDIRSIFPNSCASQIVTTCNFREWIHIFNERCCNRAQWHIRHVSNTILNHLRSVIPLIFDYKNGVGPKCAWLGYCPEHEGCGMMPTKEQFLKKK